MKCGGPNTPQFKIQTGIKGNQATWGDTLNLKINKLPEGATVTYYLDSKPIAPTMSLQGKLWGFMN